MQRIPPHELAAIVQRNDRKTLEDQLELDGDRAARLILQLRETPLLHKIEVVELSDRPVIELKDGDEYQDSTALSTGQKCTTILPILLLESERPLLIDQPEDNLDNAFIYETVVKSIRRTEGKRQLIFVTHKSTARRARGPPSRWNCRVHSHGVVRMSGPKQALVIEDEPGVADVVRYRLRQCGFADDQITVVANAVAAMQTLDTGKFDVVLLDQRLPQSERDLNPRDEVGRELLRYARRKHPWLPIIMMTAHAGRTASAASDTTAQLMKMGASDFILKPFEQSAEPFEEKVRAVLEATAPGAEGGAATATTGGTRHAVRFIPGGKVVEIDGVRVTGEIVPVLRVLRRYFLEDQRNDLALDDYRRFKGMAIAHDLKIDDDATVRRRILNFRKWLGGAYLTQHGRDIDEQAIIENKHRAGYRLNPHTVLLPP